LHEPAVWISESEVVSMMDMGEAIAAIEEGLLAEAQGDARNMVKTHLEWGDGNTLHAIGAAFTKTGFAGTKTWPHTKNGATPLLVLFDSNSGALKAVVEAFALGQMRTAAVAGVATHWLAAAEAEEFAIIGTGKQALTQVAAVVAVRPIRRIRVFSPNEEHRNDFVALVRDTFDMEAVGAASVREAVKGASIVTVITRAREPILRADMVDRGTHINAMGAIVPSRAEVCSDVLARSTQIVTDSIPQAQKLSRALLQFFEPYPGNWSAVRSLANVVANRFARSAKDDLTIFKSLGVGISDLSLGIALYQRAMALGLGIRIPHPQKVSPRLRTRELAKTLQQGG
jgi:ornithine cyclodeaminase